MGHIKKVKCIAGCLGLALIAVGLFSACNIGRVVTFSMTPSMAFDAQVPPPAPDYESPESWSALPERDDSADRAPIGAVSIDQLHAGVDVFYIHPTSYVGSRWNASTDNVALNEATDRVATGIQATVFNGCCAVYAPRYRQANGTAFTHPSANGDSAIALGYADVRRAFVVFNTRRAAGRPFILAAHSQGSLMALRLLHDTISGTALQGQLVAAYLIGGGITSRDLRERAPDVPVCSSADDLHCVVAWNARGAGYVPSEYDLHHEEVRDWVCTNPLSWRSDGASVPRDANLGAVFLETDDHAPRVAFADATCLDGTLVVAHIGAVPRDIPSRILDHVMGRGNYHAIEYQLFFMNLRENANVRVAAFTATQRE